MRCTIHADMYAPAAGRRLVSEFLEANFGAVSNRRNVVLLVSELITYAVNRGHRSIDLGLTHTRGHLLIEVTGDVAPSRHRPAGELEDDLGLLVVAGLSTMWTVSEDGADTSVSCIIPIELGTS